MSKSREKVGSITRTMKTAVDLLDGDSITIDGSEYMYIKKLIENRGGFNHIEHHFSPKDFGVKGITVRLCSKQEFRDWLDKTGVKLIN